MGLKCPGTERKDEMEEKPFEGKMLGVEVSHPWNEVSMGSDNSLDVPEEIDGKWIFIGFDYRYKKNRLFYIVFFILLVLAVLLGVMGGYSIWGI